jgi:hypothetical protein
MVRKADLKDLNDVRLRLFSKGTKDKRQPTGCGKADRSDPAKEA